MNVSVSVGASKDHFGLIRRVPNHSFIKLLGILASVLSTGYCQQISLSLLAYGASNTFPDSYAGAYIQHPNQKFLAYTYPAKKSGTWYLKLFNADSGSQIGSISSTSYSSCESLGFAGSSYIAILEKTQGIFIYLIQTVTSGSVALSYQASLSSTSITSKYFSSPISDPLTTYVYANYFGTVSYFVSPQVTVYKVDVMNVAGYNTGNIEPSTFYPTGKYSFGMGFYANDIFICMVTTGAKFIYKLNLTLAYQISGSNLGYHVVQEPTELNITYMSTYSGNSVDKRRPTNSTAANTVLSTVNIGTATVTNMLRCPMFKLLMVNANTTSVIKFINVDTFSGVLSFQPSFTGTIARLSLTSAKFESRKWYFSFVNTDAERFEYYYLSIDYCLVPGQNPCVQCISNRYLDSSSLNNNCLATNEFPSKYGIDGLYMGICLGNNSLGCLACINSVQTCTSCNSTAGFYLYPTTGKCYKLADFPSGTGLNTVTSLVEICADVNCDLCRSNKSQCLSCKSGCYLKEGTSANCFQNNIDGWGIKSVSGVQMLANCQLVNCKKCNSDFTVCTECATNYYFKEGSSATCYTNTIDNFGLKNSGSSKVITSCIDSNCVLCRADYSICTKCKAGFSYNGTGCTTYQAGIGNDGTGTLKPCTVSHCTDCFLNYALCNDCELPYYLTEGSHSSCKLNNQNYIGLKDVVGQPMLSACTVNKCKSCLSQNDNCELCENTYYPLKENNTTCKINNIDNRGLEVVNGKWVLSECSDQNCHMCYSLNVLCTKCKDGFYQILGSENSDPSCFASKIGYGLGNDTNMTIKLLPCIDKNCSECSSDNNICTKCKDTYYPYLSADGPCTLNDIPGLGIYIDSNNVAFLSACQQANCALCYASVLTCINCTEPYIFNPMTFRCNENDIPGMGKFTDPNNYAYLLKCVETECANCAAAYDLCKACVSGDMEVMDDKCVWRNNKRIGLRTPIYYSKKTNSFQLTFDGPPFLNISNMLEGYSYSLKKHDSSDIEPNSYSLRVTRTGENIFSGFISSSNSIEESTLSLQSKNRSRAFIRNETNLYDPGEPIIINEIAISNYAKSADDTLSTVTKVSMTAAAVAGALTLGGTSNGRQAAMMIKVIDSVEFTLYLNGVRVYRAVYFLYILQANFLQLIPTIYKFDEGSLGCIPHPNFDREGISCNFLNNYGSELSTIVVGIAMIVLVRLVHKGVQKIEVKTANKRKIKSILNAIMWVPSKIFGNSLLIIMVDGSQIDIFRLCFLNLIMVNQTLGMIIGSILSALLLTVYGYFAFILFTNARSQKIITPAKNSLLHMEKKATLVYSKFEDTPKNFAFDEIQQENKSNTFIDLSEFYEVLKLPQANSINLHLYIPLINLIKSMLTQFTIVFLDVTDIYQLWIILAIECICLIIMIFLRPYKKAIDQFVGIGSAVALTLIGITNVMANIQGVSLSFRDREIYYGSTLIGLYIFAIVIGLAPLIVDAIKNIITLTRWIYPKKQVAVVPSVKHSPSISSMPLNLSLKSSPRKARVSLQTNILNLNNIEKTNYEEPIDKKIIVERPIAKKSTESLVKNLKRQGSTLMSSSRSIVISKLPRRGSIFDKEKVELNRNATRKNTNSIYGHHRMSSESHRSLSHLP